jgi:aminoglycoside 6'-N-acetyltransferase I
MEEWLRMRSVLWPHCLPEQLRLEMREWLSNPEKRACFVVEASPGRLCGFLEAGLRDYADGCDTSPVGYIEGWYVDASYQRMGLGRALVRAAEEWARSKGLRQMASDCELDNHTSLAAHLALGYEEAERSIHFCKNLMID